VLWEVSETDSPKASDLNTDTSDLRGFAKNLGYSLPQPAIGRMHNGKFAAIVANGYASVNGLGVLYILDIQTGEIIATIDTKIVSSGLSTPFAADVDLDGTVDAIYAGDLQGNMWKFDVSADNPLQWKVAYGTTATPAPLFTACTDATNTSNCDLSRQRITNIPQVGQVGTAQSKKGVMVYFGTGKYFEDSDNNIADTKTQSFYGIWDKCGLVKDIPTGTTHSCPATTGSSGAGVQKNTLVKQSIIAELKDLNLRITSNSDVDYSTKMGWYMDFEDVNSGTTPKENNGERIVSASLLRGGRIVFVTLIPIPPTLENIDQCGPGSKSTSWLMELDALTGSRVSSSSPALDINNNGIVDSSDVITVTVAGVAITVPASGIKNSSGSTKTPAVISVPGKDEIKFTGSSEAAKITKGIAEDSGVESKTGAGRQSWRQL
jgi:type IV pilus assembly protein PilY1